MTSNDDLVKRDLESVWHPCTQMKDHEWMPMIPIKKGDGVYLQDFDGNRYIDAISSWWVNLFGHANSYISDKISHQLTQLEHVLLAGFTHEPAINLAERLIRLTPPGLNKCFYADNGSSAIEVALKMSYHYWLNQGQGKKSKFITLTNSYHGETLGALAVGHVELYKQTYDPLLMHTIAVPSPDCFYREPGVSNHDHSELMFEHMDLTLERHANEVAAVIVEPLVQCAGNMRMYDAVYLKRLREACDKYNVHLIADEIAVGFGRSGTMFACEQAEITPDFMCLSKGLTGGYLPLAVCLTHQSIYDAFYDEYEKLSAFLHSHSYTGNALACTAANATLDLFEQQDVIGNNRKTSQSIITKLEALRDHPHVGDIRQTGMITAVEMMKDKTKYEEYDWRERRGVKVYTHALSKGVLLRPLANVIYFMPPYVIDEPQIETMINTAIDGINIATSD